MQQGRFEQNVRQSRLLSRQQAAVPNNRELPSYGAAAASDVTCTPCVLQKQSRQGKPDRTCLESQSLECCVSCQCSASSESPRNVSAGCVCRPGIPSHDQARHAMRRLVQAHSTLDCGHLMRIIPSYLSLPTSSGYTLESPECFHCRWLLCNPIGRQMVLAVRVGMSPGGLVHPVKRQN